MFRVLIGFFALMLVLGCSKADQQAAGSKVPSPGLDHLTQVYVVADLEDAQPLVLNFLASFNSSIPNGKLYVTRPQSPAEAEKALREWSARQMDWLVISGKASREAFLKSKISWANTKKILMIDHQPSDDNRQELGPKVVELRVDAEMFNQWSKKYCTEQKKAPECSASKTPHLFEWSHVLSESFEPLVDVSWGWSSFLRTVGQDVRPKSYMVSFKDGFLTLILRNKAKENPELAQRMDQWIRQQALAGLGK